MYPRLFIRLCSYCIDFIFIAIGYVIVFEVFGAFFIGKSFDSSMVFSVLAFVVFLLPIIYYVVLPATKMQGTLGQYFLNIRVVDEWSLDRIGFLKSFVRFVFFVVSWIFMLGFITIFFTEKKQMLHDIFSKTVLLYKSN